MRAAAVAVELIGDDSMVIAGGIHPRYAQGQEGQLRATALVLEQNGTKLCLISCDVLMIGRDILDEAARSIERQSGIPFANILISATHTHHAPSTVRVHGYDGDEKFIAQLKEAVVSAALKANEKIAYDAEIDLHFWLSQEATVGQNSRLLLSDGTIYWVGPRDDAIRPTGPFDPELPVWAFKKPKGQMVALMFNHSTHTIGTRKGEVRSPSFYGLAAQELEMELGGTALFFLGAAGSTHNLTLSTDEMVFRIKQAIKEGLTKAQRREVKRLIAVKKEFAYRVRTFDEDAEEKAVAFYCHKRIKDNPEATIEVFRKMRQALAPHQGEERKTWLQVILIDDIAIVGIPGELFTSLGVEIKRRSPFRYTYIFTLANDWIGYIPDEEGFRLGGYQVWTGFHSFVEKGTGEKILEETISLLKALS
ncbi:MAG: hypothetical protein NZ937_00220 [Armatimonadetes bacterium]|nr:hypothetical protein [Armatimonadota bacterium]